MSTTIRCFTGCVLLALVAGGGNAGEKGGKKVAPILSFTMKGIDGKNVDLARYQGKVLLIVNVASECGYTSQYEQLQALHKKYADKGLAVLGIPCNDFGGQEPGTEAEIKTFCTKKYGVTFDLFSKIRIEGKEAAPLYRFLTSKDTNPKFGGKVTWNFEKFLVGRDGSVVARFASDAELGSPEFVATLEKALGAK